MRTIGVLGGSGLYEIEGLENIERQGLDTPFGSPSDDYVIGTLGDARLVFLPRHGRGHRIPPHQLNYRANIHGLKQLGVEWILSVSAVGSMREEIRPGDIVVIDQLFDRTKGRASTFFDDGVVGHIPFADPVCPKLGEVLVRAAQEVVAGSEAKVHASGTYLVIEGPQFSTRAESKLYRQWGIDVIGMTNLPEAKLAREAEICYSTVALATDYDCWHETEADVSADTVMKVMAANSSRAKKIVRKAAELIPAERSCLCASAAAHAVMTAPDAIPESARERLALLLEKYLRKP
jgi:5'-methylthioadenosine phosphorylase